MDPGLSGFYLAPAIPTQKLKNARAGTACPADEEVLALIDASVFGGAKNCLLVGRSGIYTRWQGKAVQVPYTRFPELNFSVLPDGQVFTGEQTLLPVGSAHDSGRVAVLLTAIKEVMLGHAVQNTFERVFRRHLALPCFHVTPGIQDSKVKNASESCNLEQDDRILALIDLTAFGSAKNCIAFSTHTMYYHNTSKLLAIRYMKFPNTAFSVKADKITDRGLLADDMLLDMGGYGHSVKDVLVLLNEIKATAAEAEA